MPASTTGLATPQTDLDLIQGCWTSVAGPGEARFLVAGRRFCFEFVGGDIYMGTIELDGSQMDMLVEEGPDEHKGQVAPCLFRIEGDVLRWCPGRIGSGRKPTIFPSVDDCRYLSFVFRHARQRRRRAAS